VQVAPGRHWHVEPHLQFGPQAHDAVPVLESVPAAALAESTLFAVEFI
jgi:hypothetical protein